MSEHTINLKPTDTLSVRLDESSLADAHGKGDAALAATRDHAGRIEVHDGALAKHGRLIQELGNEKADEATVDVLTGRVADLEAELRNRPTKADLEAIDQKLSERIRLAANLGELLPTK